MKKVLKLKKSQILIFGSFLIFVGFGFLLSGHFLFLKEEIFEKVRLSFIENSPIHNNQVMDAEDVTNVDDSSLEENTTSSSNNNSNTTTSNQNTFKYDYIGYLEIPKIRLKRGFLSKESKYNDIRYNIMVSYNADFPDVENGNFILVAHSGDAYISFFAYLYKLIIGDFAYVTYGGIKYKYQLVKIEEQEKTGVVAIHRPNYQIKGLTLITCTKDNDFAQSIYIFEMV